MRFSFLLFSFALWCTGFQAIGQNLRYDLNYGAQAATQLEQYIGLYQDSLLTEYIHKIGKRLVAGLGPQPFNYQFFILDLDDPNAFSLPGGYIYITRGLLPLVNTEDELACVIAHEIIHSHKRHSIRQMKKNILPGILLLPGSIVGEVVGEGLGNLINVPFSKGAQAWMAGYSRKHEREADKLGLELAAKVGYAPGQLAIIIGNIRTLATFKTGLEEGKNYLKSHPFTPERVEYIQIEAAKQTVEKLDKITHDSLFIYHFDQMVIGQNPGQGLVDESRFVHPEKDIYFTFPRDWPITNSPMVTVAVQPDNEGVVLLKVDSRFSHPEEAGEAQMERLKSLNLEAIVHKPTHINNNPAYMVGFKIQTREQMVFIQNVWISKDSILYNVTGYGLENHMDKIQESVMSFKEITPELYRGLDFTCLKIVKTKEEETIANLLAQNGTDDFLGFTNIINHIQQDSVIRKNEVVKIVIKKPVKPPLK